jgi:hypothetical protein
MKHLMKNRLNARPHPGPLPQERENRLPPHRISCGWIGRTGFRVSPSSHWLHPLPGGEGRGEGERYFN